MSLNRRCTLRWYDIILIRKRVITFSEYSSPSACAYGTRFSDDMRNCDFMYSYVYLFKQNVAFRCYQNIVSLLYERYSH